MTARLLIIDDEPLVRRSLRRILEGVGHQIAEAENGVAGASSYRANPPDVVICDMVMPAQDGLSTLKELRAGYPSIKFIAMSGGARSSTHSFLQMAVELGAVATLDKPLTKANVIETVAAVLSRNG